ncbi:MAG: hypothetical protein WB775_05250 [Burkholderiaceae bacterium]|jgi:hypothetical protein
MSSTIIAILILASCCAGLLLTLRLRHRLPPHHEEEGTRDLIKIATGMLATLVALILGLLVSSAKGTFDTATAEITQSGAQIITLNRTLANYGPEAKPVQVLLQHNLAASIERIWPGRQAQAPGSLRVDASTTEILAQAIRELSPKDDAQKHLQAKALAQLATLAEGRWLVFEQMQNPLPQVFLIVLGFWLILLFIGLGLIAPRNSTSVIAMLSCALSMSAAVFLILEMNHPLDGLIKVSSAPLEAALVVIRK